MNKRYSVVKWLENSHFDPQNEWVGRVACVQHSNIIDIDPDELKSGMEISVFRNGEIWRAQVIIPKTTNSIDLQPTNNKIRTKALSTMPNTIFLNNNSIKLNDQLLSSCSTSSSSSASSTSSQLDCLDKNSTFVDLNSLTLLNPDHSTSSNSNIIILSTPSATQNTNILQQSSFNSNNNDIKMVNVLQQVNDVNIETVLQMQCELLNQQKELKNIEIETMEQLRLLQENINKLSRKFDSFELIVSNQINSNSLMVNNDFNNNISSSVNSQLKSTKSTLNKINHSIQQIKVYNC